MTKEICRAIIFQAMSNGVPAVERGYSPFRTGTPFLFLFLVFFRSAAYFLLFFGFLVDLKSDGVKEGKRNTKKPVSKKCGFVEKKQWKSEKTCAIIKRMIRKNSPERRG